MLFSLLLVLLLWCSGTHLDVEHCYTLFHFTFENLYRVLSRGHIRKRYQHIRKIHVFFCHSNSLSHSGLKDRKLKLGKILHVNQKIENSKTKTRKLGNIMHLMQF